MKNNIIITIDYETWHPACKKDIEIMRTMGLKIDWEKDIINPTEKLLDCADKVGVKLTLMAEMGEYFWLKENEPRIAQKIALQLQEAVIRGHDVQLHLHPHWMPETGARCDAKGEWQGNIEFASFEKYPFDLNELIERCKKELESIICVVEPQYRVSCFRAGGYRVQPFERLWKALVENDIKCDTSVYANGKDVERGIDFTTCKRNNYPYYASKFNPSIEDKSNKSIIEFPIYSSPQGKRWMLDEGMQNEFAYVFLEQDDDYMAEDNYYIIVGHTKGNHDYAMLEKQFDILSKLPGTNWITLNKALDKVQSDVESKNNNIVKIECIENFYERMICENVEQRKEIFYAWLKKNKYFVQKKCLLSSRNKYEALEVVFDTGRFIFDLKKEKIYEISWDEWIKKRKISKSGKYFICLTNCNEIVSLYKAKGMKEKIFRLYKKIQSLISYRMIFLKI